MKEGGSLFGGTCEHCEDRAPSGPRQDSVRTLSGLCQDYVRTLSGLCQDCQDSCGSSTNQVSPSRRVRPGLDISAAEASQATHQSTAGRVSSRV